jgi:uncharacterized protein (DUF4213/DUF364 family)
MHLRSRILESVRKSCADTLELKIRNFLKPPVLESKVAPFSVAVLENGAIGISYNLFHRDAEALERYRRWDMQDIVGSRPEEIIPLFLSEDPVEKTAGLAVLNALSQDFISRNPGSYRIDATSNLFSLMGLDKSSRVGLVGYFRPMMEKLLSQAGEVIVLEECEELLRGTYPFTMTGDPGELRRCDKVLITGTTVLNDSLPELMAFCTGAKFVTVMGPTAGFLPDALFDLGIHAVGYSRVEKPELFLHLFSNGMKWDDSTRKVWIMPQ